MLQSGSFNAIHEAIREGGVRDVTLRLTLILVLLYGSTSPLANVTIRLLCGLMLVFPQFLTGRFLWIMIGIVMATANGLLWHSIDNHKYLITYWVLACGLALIFPNRRRQEEYLRKTATWMIGLVFLFATLWKLCAGEYLDGKFFYFTFLSDSRLSYATSLISGLSTDDLQLGREALRFLGTVPLHESELEIAGSARLRTVTLLLSWATIAGEGAIAALYLWQSRRLYAVRQGLLMCFIGATYFLLPVIGFAAILTLLGFASSRKDDDAGRAIYVILFGVIHLTLIPWQRVLASVL